MEWKTKDWPTGLTRKQLDLLMLVWPGPVGQGLTVAEAARGLNITVRAAQYRLKHFKQRFPEAWEKYESARELLRQDRLKIHDLVVKRGHDCSLEGLEEVCGNDVIAEEIVERF